MADDSLPLRLHADAAPVIDDDMTLTGRDGPYLADRGLRAAANVALTMGMPLLLTGEPGCGKTDFAFVMANALAALEPDRSATDRKLLQCHVRSDSRATDLLYHYDALLRFADGHHGDDDTRAQATDPRHYIELQALGIALMSQTRRVVLIDEIDKAPRDLPNDLLRELDRGEFEIREIRRQQRASEPVVDASGVPLTRVMVRPPGAPMPVVVITSNVERQLPDPFLRRCVFYHIPFPDRDRLLAIVRKRAKHDRPGDPGPLALDKMVDIFVALRQIPELVKRPSTAELLAWTGALATTFAANDIKSAINAFHQALGEQGKLAHKTLRWTQLPGLSCLLKLREDLKTAHDRWGVPEPRPQG